MKKLNALTLCLAIAVTVPCGGLSASEPSLEVPRFSVQNMDRSVEPASDFYHFAAGNWIKNNPVPADKSRWSGFEELQERNWRLIREILEATAADQSAAARSPRRQVGDFFISAMDTNRLEKLGFNPIARDLKRIDRLKSSKAMFELLGDFHERGIGGLFRAEVTPDAKNSSFYAFEVSQGGLGLPDRDYYLKDDFAQQREDYRHHVAKMLTLVGEKPAEAAARAALVLEIETALAKASRTRVELRDPNANYNKFTVAAFEAANSASAWPSYLAASGLEKLTGIIVGQPEFFAAINKIVGERPLADWKVYLRWHRSAPPRLSCTTQPSRRILHSTAQNSAASPILNRAGNAPPTLLTAASARPSASFTSRNISRPPPARA